LNGGEFQCSAVEAWPVFGLLQDLTKELHSVFIFA
jgi:hypothetical protein